MTLDSRTTVTRLLVELDEGSRSALDELVPLVYEELRALAHAQRRRWHGQETLGTTALVNEAYLKLVDGARIRAGSREHFLSVAARAMRQILSNYARDQGTHKRGGALRKVSYDRLKIAPAQAAFSPEQADELVALNDALASLEETDPRRGKVVECRFYGGMTVEETAVALGVSPRTVKRDWAVAQAWLQREMEASGG